MQELHKIRQVFFFLVRCAEWLFKRFGEIRADLFFAIISCMVILLTFLCKSTLFVNTTETKTKTSLIQKCMKFGNFSYPSRVAWVPTQSRKVENWMKETQNTIADIFFILITNNDHARDTIQSKKRRTYTSFSQDIRCVGACLWYLVTCQLATPWRYLST